MDAPTSDRFYAWWSGLTPAGKLVVARGVLGVVYHVVVAPVVYYVHPTWSFSYWGALEFGFLMSLSALTLLATGDSIRPGPKLVSASVAAFFVLLISVACNTFTIVTMWSITPSQALFSGLDSATPPVVRFTWAAMVVLDVLALATLLASAVPSPHESE